MSDMVGRRPSMGRGTEMKLGFDILGMDVLAIGRPTWTRVVQVGMNVKAKNCPDCQAHLCEVEIKIKHKKLKGGRGTSRYRSCPVCKYSTTEKIYDSTGREVAG